MVTKITAYGGINEIGGNKILIEDEGTRIFLDFGLSFLKYNSYFSPYMQPRGWALLADLIKLGLIPNLEGLYRTDFERRIREPRKEPAFDGVLLSHPHLDHAGFVSLLRPDIPIYCSKETHAILEAMEQTSYSSMAEFTAIKEKFKLRESKRDKNKLVKDRDSIIPRQLIHFKPTFKIDNIVVHTFKVDHSVPGATAFIIETSAAIIAYTGDIRFHGREANYSRYFAEKLAEFSPDYLITEGTRIDDDEKITELDITRNVYNLTHENENLVIVNFPIRDMQRMRSFVEAAEATERKLVVNMRQAYTLSTLEKFGVTDYPRVEDVAIFIPLKGWGIWNNEDYPEEIRLQDYLSWEKELLNRENAITSEELIHSPDSYIFRCDYTELKYLLDIYPPEGSIYIRSITEPVDDEMEIDERRARNWLKFFNINDIIQLHCSGHARYTDLKHMIEEAQPRYVVPIHTEKPKLFKELHKEILELQPAKEVTLH